MSSGDEDPCMLRFERKKVATLKHLDSYVYANHSRSISDLFPIMTRFMEFDQSTDHDEGESVYELSVCGEPYDLRQCALCKKLLFVTRKVEHENRKQTT